MSRIIDDICNHFKHEHPLIRNILYSYDVNEYQVQFLMETIHGTSFRYYIPYTLDPSEEEILKALNTLYAALIKLENWELYGLESDIYGRMDR